MGRTERNEVAHAHQSLAARCSRERIGARRSSRCIGRGLEPQGRRRQGGPAAQPHLKDEVSGDDLATMETKNEVLAGDFSTGEGKRSSGKVQQHAVWTLMWSRRWPVATASMIGSAGIDMLAHM